MNQHRQKTTNQDIYLTATGDKIFAGKTFVLYGFDEEGIPALTAYIKEGGGVVLQTSDRHIPDYAIVPMDGFPVDRTVNNIVTNTWMIFPKDTKY
ncbi:hypothetical protein DPMN_079272 [Dreissena polymorpha]|uniref:Uncharacterized protein n=1 Tax=Dreissena polymorpha TaxID=45954 RepID=A0A9D3YTG8_DREPO|nr:hypothetical protein DPMN_079272 [Dreissena polymorpha]